MVGFSMLCIRVTELHNKAGYPDSATRKTTPLKSHNVFYKSHFNVLYEKAHQK